MSIANESRMSSEHVALAAADVLTALGDAGIIFDIVSPITVLRVGEVITTAVVSNVTAQVAFDRRIVTSGDVGRVAALDGTNGVLLIPTGTAIGKVVFKDVRVDLDPGDQIVPEVTVAAAGPGAAGAGRYFYEYIERHETPANCADMVLSA